MNETLEVRNFARVAARLDAISPAMWRLRDTPTQTTVCTTAHIPIEVEALDQIALIGGDEQRRASERVGGSLTAMYATPDLHPGAGIPIGCVTDTVGVVLPSVIGNDVGCGMALAVIDVDADELIAHRATLQAALRRRFFEGARDLATTPALRRVLLTDGVAEFCRQLEAAGAPGTWSVLGALDDPARSRYVTGQATGPLPAPLIDWVQGSARHDNTWTFDNSLGSIGGGNHFVELQAVDKLYGPAAHHFGLFEGRVTVMAHTGSLWFGHRTGELGLTAALAAWGPTHRPAIIPLALDTADDWFASHDSSSAFAAGNRLACVAVAIRAITDVIGSVPSVTFVHDAGHNTAERDGNTVRHRKGATPAMGPTDQDWFGQPILVPGSMGADSYILTGTGSEHLAHSACHGAGRARSRGAVRADSTNARLDAFLEQYSIVTPIDPSRVRSDIAAAWYASLAEEAPWAYKDISPVIEALELANVAKPVARCHPIATVKQI